MKTACFIALLIMCKCCFAQKWTQLGSTSIQYISVTSQGDTIALFRKDSAAIAMRPELFEGFKELFLYNQGSFAIINDSCSHIGTYMLSDGAGSVLKTYGIGHVVYFIKLDVKKTGDEETWLLTNLYGQGQPCWPAIVMKRSRNKAIPVKFLTIFRGFCQI